MFMFHVQISRLNTVAHNAAAVVYILLSKFTANIFYNTVPISELFYACTQAVVSQISSFHNI